MRLRLAADARARVIAWVPSGALCTLNCAAKFNPDPGFSHRALQLEWQVTGNGALCLFRLLLLMYIF